MIRTATRAALALLVLAAALGAATSAARAGTCRQIAEKAEAYTICEITGGEDLRLFLNAPDGKPYGTFERLSDALDAAGQRLVLAMNGGMYHPDRRPVGLYVENGRQLARLVTREGPGNFGLLPNGVFCISGDRFRVIESRTYKARPPACRFASQSGPMLVIAGELHPRFLENSTSRNIRNGVGVSADGRRAWLVISDRPVTFHAFASLFRDRLKTPNALYLDGKISRLYAPALGRADPGRPMGPILGLVAGG